MRVRVAAVVGAVVLGLTLAGCDGGGSDKPEAGTAAETGGGAAEVDFGTARAATGVMAEQQIATPGSQGGGTVTVTLRAVEVTGQAMNVRWALRWDNDDAAPDAGLSFYDMGVTPVMTVTDGANLKAYRPFCTEGTWKPTKSATDTDDIRCMNTQVASPIENVTFKFPNHGTIEAWAMLPAPEGKPATVDVAPAEGLPAFTGATVTYLDATE